MSGVRGVVLTVRFLCELGRCPTPFRVSIEIDLFVLTAVALWSRMRPLPRSRSGCSV